MLRGSSNAGSGGGSGLESSLPPPAPAGDGGGSGASQISVPQKAKKMLRGLPEAVGGSEMTPADKAKISQYQVHSWNVFRYIGDYLHLFGVFVLLATLIRNRSCRGISRSTQVIFFCIFVCRYLDVLDPGQNSYLVFFKLTYIITSVIVLVIFWQLRATYERQKDTCSLPVIFIPCLTAAVLLSNELDAKEMLWTLSQFLEGFAMVPQYIFCYRDRGAKDMGVSLYVISLGGYRVFYAANWIYKKVQMPHYQDIQSWIGGIIDISFFADYLLSLFTGHSLLRTLVLKVDEKINEIQEQVEMKVLGSSSRQKLQGDSTMGSELRQRRRGDEGVHMDPVDV